MNNDEHSPSPATSQHLSARRRIWVQRGQYRLAVNDYPGTEPAFILMHGFPDDSHLWDAMVTELGGRRVITFDFLGWGESDKPRDYEYTFKGQMQDLDAVLASLQLEQVELVGHDSSVTTALDWALDHPERTSSVTVMNGFYITGGAMRPPALISLLALGQLPAGLELGPLPAGVTLGLTSLGEQMERDDDMFLSIWRWQQRGFFAREQDADHFIPLFEQQFVGPDNSIAPLRSLTAGIFTSIAGHAARLDELAQLTVPVNVVWGAEDPDLAVGQAHRIHEIIPGSRLILIDGARHNVPIDEPAAVASVLLAAGPNGLDLPAALPA